MNDRCIKCQTDIIDVIIRNSKWCRKCFVDQINIKFFQGIKPAKEFCRPLKESKKTPTDFGSILIHFKNDLSSIVLLELLKKYLENNEARSTERWKSPIDFYSIEVAWVELGSASELLSFKTSNEELIERLDSLTTQEGSNANVGSKRSKASEIKQIVESFGFKFVLIKLDDLFPCGEKLTTKNSQPVPKKLFVNISNSSLPLKLTEELPSRNSTPLQELLKPLSNTSRVSFIESLVSKSLMNFCSSSKTRNKVLVKPTNSTEMSIDTLSGVSLGGGWNLTELIGSTSNVNDVLICRPLSLIVNLELKHYLRLTQPSRLEGYTFSTPNLNTKKTDIKSLVKDFVIRLEEDYPMTSSVINQTANKIGQNHDESKESSLNNSLAENNEVINKFSKKIKCSICNLPCDKKSDDWKKAITLDSNDDIYHSKRKTEEDSKSAVNNDS
ncbi:hypothetical protein BY996DRAFT_8157021 [Phakopsora pachyrhizi]|nr:hypothetical protein BY996DRAFT_8157021 [Phakopsora pachyrhizi]